MKRFRWYWLLLAPLACALGFNVYGMITRPPPTTPRPDDLALASRKVVPSSGEDDQETLPPPRTIGGNGVVEPGQRETQVASAVPGRIAVVQVREGQQVAAGDILVEFDSEVERAAVTAAEAEVEAARATLLRTVRGSRAEDVRASTADADQAKARAELSRGVLERTERLVQGGGATIDELDRARRQAQGDAAAAAAAEARQEALINGSRREDVQLARAQLAAAEARLAQARAQLARLIVRAPIQGEVLQVKYRAGEYYQPGGGALVVMGDTSRLTVRMDVDERDVGGVQLGAPVIVRANAFPGVDFGGKVIEIGRRMGRKNVRTDDPTERNDTKILEVVVALEQPRGLVVGQRVTCYIEPAQPSTAASGTAGSSGAPAAAQAAPAAP